MTTGNSPIIHDILAADELLRQRALDAERAALKERQNARAAAQRQQQDAANQEFAGALAEVRARNEAREKERQKKIAKAEADVKNGKRDWKTVDRADLRAAIGRDLGIWL